MTGLPRCARLNRAIRPSRSSEDEEGIGAAAEEDEPEGVNVHVSPVGDVHVLEEGGVGAAAEAESGGGA